MTSRVRRDTQSPCPLTEPNPPSPTATGTRPRPSARGCGICSRTGQHSGGRHRGTDRRHPGQGPLRRFARAWPQGRWAIEGVRAMGTPLTTRLADGGIAALDVPAMLPRRIRGCGPVVIVR
jgi:hypothetical protein